MSRNQSDEPAGALSEPASSPVRDVPLIVGTNLRQLRKAKGHSLERLAELSGVSRAMLGQIETGKSTPTVSLLWRIADALGVPVKTLLATKPEVDVLVLRRAGASLLAENDGALVSRDLFPVERAPLRFLELRIAPLQNVAFPAAAIGTRHSLVVTTGTVSVDAGTERPVSLQEGDAIVFEAAQASVIENTSPDQAIVYLVVLAPTG